MPARPFIIAEDHRAVLEGEFDIVVACMGDDVGPDLERFLPIVVDMLGGVATAEGVDDRNAHMTGSDDDFLQMIDDSLAMAEVWMKRVRVIAKRGDRKSHFGEIGGDFSGARSCDCRD